MARSRSGIASDVSKCCREGSGGGRTFYVKLCPKQLGSFATASSRESRLKCSAQIAARSKWSMCTPRSAARFFSDKSCASQKNSLPPLLFLHGSYHAAWCWQVTMAQCRNSSFHTLIMSMFKVSLSVQVSKSACFCHEALSCMWKQLQQCNCDHASPKPSCRIEQSP